MIKKVKNFTEGINLHSHGFRKITLIRDINRDNRTSRVLVLLSSGRRSVVIRYLMNKLIWDELSVDERTILLAFPEALNYPNFEIQLSITREGKRAVRERLKKISPILGLQYTSRQQYLSIQGQLLISFYEEERILSKTIKYSGYSRSHNDHGSINEKSGDEPLSVEYSPIIDHSSILLNFLTVGEFPFRGILLPDDGPESPKR